MRPTVTGVVLAAALLVPAIASAQEGAGFGRSGEVAITWDQALASTYMGSVLQGPTGSALVAVLPPPSWSMIDIQHTSLDNNGGSVTRVGLAPALDYFVVDNLSLGAQLLFDLVTISPGSVGAGQPQPQGTTITTFGIAPQVGYNIALGDNFSIWPKLFFAYSNSSQSNNGPTGQVFTLGGFVPFLYHPVRHFFLGIGPNLSTQLGNSSSVSASNVTTTTYSDKATAFGIMATFGGYFGG
jgi:hypothetical protein